MGDAPLQQSKFPLSGVRVADFTWVGAGPFLTKPLADHGAEVIKIESRTRTDPIRRMRPFKDGVPGLDRSGYFANRNSSKRSICLDLKDPRGRDIALELIAGSDVVVNNFAAGTLDRLGLGFQQAKKVREDIIFLDMPMQGVTGPHSDYRGYGLTIGAVSGFLGASGWPDRPPLGTGTNFPDHVPNPLHAAIAVLAALRNRRRTGAGQYIELAQLESTVNVVGSALVEEQIAEFGFRRHGNDDSTRSPHGVFPCRGDDRWIAIAVETDGQWRSLCEVLPGLSDPVYDTRRDRLLLRDRINAAVRARTRTWDVGELVASLHDAGVPAAQVNDAVDLLDDEQLRQRGHWVTLDHKEMGPTIYDAPPYSLSRTPGRLRGPAPLLGGDTEHVVVDLLGHSVDEYRELAVEGVVG